MKESQLRLFIRSILLEDFVPQHQKKQFYNALSRGIRTGRGEKVAPTSDEKAKNYFEVAEGEALQYLQTFQFLYKELTGAGMSPLDKKLDPNVATHKHATGLLSSMFNFAKNSNASNREALTHRMTQPEDVKKIITSYKNLDPRLQPKLIDCIRQFQGFLNKIGDGLSTTVGNIIIDMRK